MHYRKFLNKNQVSLLRSWGNGQGFWRICVSDGTQLLWCHVRLLYSLLVWKSWFYMIVILSFYFWIFWMGDLILSHWSVLTVVISKVYGSDFSCRYGLPKKHKSCYNRLRNDLGTGDLKERALLSKSVGSSIRFQDSYFKSWNIFCTILEASVHNCMPLTLKSIGIMIIH